MDSSSPSRKEYAVISTYPTPNPVIIGIPSPDIVPRSIIRDEAVMIQASFSGISATTGEVVPPGIVIPTIDGTVTAVATYSRGEKSKGIPYIVIEGEENYADITVTYMGITPSVRVGQRVTTNDMLGNACGFGSDRNVFAYGVTLKGSPINVDDIHAIKIPRKQ
jgi:hypothetical protein